METKKITFLFFLALALVLGGYNLGRSSLGPKQGEDLAQRYGLVKGTSNNSIFRALATRLPLIFKGKLMAECDF